MQLEEALAELERAKRHIAAQGQLSEMFASLPMTADGTGPVPVIQRKQSHRIPKDKRWLWPVPGVLAAAGIGLKGGMKVKVKTAMTGMALPGMATITVLSLAHAHTAQYSTVYVPPGSSAPSMSDPDTPARVILPAARLSSDPKVLPHVTVKAPVRRPFAAAPLPAPLPAPAPAPVPVSAPAAAVSSQTQVASSQSSQSSQQSDSSPWQAHGRHAGRDSGDGNSGYQGRHGDNGSGSNYWQDGQQGDTWQGGQQQGGGGSSQASPAVMAAPADTPAAAPVAAPAPADTSTATPAGTSAPTPAATAAPVTAAPADTPTTPAPPSS